MRSPRPVAASLLGAALFAAGCATAPGSADMTVKPATPATVSANQAMRPVVAAFDRRDLEDAARGKLAQLSEPLVKTPDGRTVWDTRQFDFLEAGAPDTANPSLWRLQQMNQNQGLFKVADGIYQIRGYDIAGLPRVEGQTGWIVIDTMLTAPVARAGLKLAMDTLKSTKPVVAVIYTHSHADHFGGVRGVVDEADVRSGKVRIIAPDAFMEYAISENVLAGNAMSRRGNYMFGISLPAGDKGSVGTGLGVALSEGAPGLIPPNVIVKKTGEELVVDGVRMQFQMAQGSEAPSEFMVYFPDRKALCLSEVVTKLMHNVYTIRGAKVRDALGWSKYINETLDLYPGAEVAFASHHWPTWGKDNIRGFLAKQRDTYRFLHDRALNLANQGQVMDENGKPVRKALIEVWQANRWGKYEHPDDTTQAPLDPNFKGWGRALTDSQGRYTFRSIKPGAYPNPGYDNWMRPPHVHFSLFAAGLMQRLITQMYFPGEEYNDIDPILNGVEDLRARASLIARRMPDEPEGTQVYQFDIVLRGSQETPFFVEGK